MTAPVTLDDIGAGLPTPPRGKVRPSRGARIKRRAIEVAPALALFLALIAAWEVIRVGTDQPAYILPSVGDILSTAVEKRDVLMPALWITLKEILAGFALAIFIGMTLAIGIVYVGAIRRAVLPVVIASQAVPVIAVAPILVIWFGFGMLPKVLMAAVIAFFPVVINGAAGLASVDRDSLNLMRSLDASGWTTFRKLRVPAALPLIFAGLKNAAVISVIGAIVGEWVGAEKGLGPVIIAANASFNTDVVFAAILYLATVGVLLFLLVSVLERLTIPWYFLTRGGSDRG